VCIAINVGTRGTAYLMVCQHAWKERHVLGDAKLWSHGAVVVYVDVNGVPSRQQRRPRWRAELPGVERCEHHLVPEMQTRKKVRVSV
jgi:hypothetical protein